MGTGKPVGFAARVQWVRVQCPICRPAPTPYPSWVTRGFQPPILMLAHTGGSSCARRHLSLLPPHSTHPKPAIPPRCCTPPCHPSRTQTLPPCPSLPPHPLSPKDTAPTPAIPQGHGHHARAPHPSRTLHPRL